MAKNEDFLLKLTVTCKAIFRSKCRKCAMTHMTLCKVANKIAKPLFCSDEQKYRKINIHGQRVSRLNSDEETTW